ncbi:myo-inositol-1-monophosphatase [Amylocarpus encephaloides]|uniref:Inositol-1-monophosphatase n=1 Tax=Amylocarpus encephaloides TaxID=45428 RepID=A0A9P7YB85_9HELO|nr:myo-inositol-1-monophosphatase [Amylocarpus encephaloides]
MADINLQEIHDLLIEIAYEAGRLMLTATPSYLDSGTKKNSVDLVTETDRAVEFMVSSRLSKAYPSYSFIGEETYVPGETTLTSAPTFICDPVDGTTNFVHAFPAFCISLGFTVDKIPSVGVIYNPFLDELYTGIKGKGSFVTKKANGGGMEKLKLPLKKEPELLKDLSTCLIGAEWGSDRVGNNFDLKCKVFTKLAASKENGGAMVHSLRCVGSAALNLALVASGQQDVFWEGGCWAWDVAAGWCILEEAGGIMASGNPGNWNPEVDSRAYLAIRGAPSGQKEIVEEFWEVVGNGRLDYKS